MIRKNVSRFGWMLGLCIAGCAWAQEKPPVVQITGRTSDRPIQPSVITPTAIGIQPATGAPVAQAPSLQPVSAPSAGAMPIGSIVAWVNIFTNTAGLPAEWVPCNGQMVADVASPLVGQYVPNLNGFEGQVPRFLRGSTIGGTLGGAETHSHDGYRSQKYGTQRSPVAAPTPANHLPPYYDVIWIIRIR